MLLGKESDNLLEKDDDKLLICSDMKTHWTEYLMGRIDVLVNTSIFKAKKSPRFELCVPCYAPATGYGVGLSDRVNMVLKPQYEIDSIKIKLNYFRFLSKNNVIGVARISGRFKSNMVAGEEKDISANLIIDKDGLFSEFYKP